MATDSSIFVRGATSAPVRPPVAGHLRSEVPLAVAACPRCGLRGGQHADAAECIDSLRDLVARLEFKVEQRAGKPAPLSQPSHRGGRRERKDQRTVMLDGERLCLTEAARRLGLAASALHWRIFRRTGDAAYQNVDVRAIGADVARR